MKKTLSALLAGFLIVGCNRQPSYQHEPMKADLSGKFPVDYVDPFIGTGGEGHTYPGATVPFGMVQVSPDTKVPYFRGGFPWCAGYQYGDSSITGFSHTHFSGTGHSDMGDVLIMPVTGHLQLESGDSENPDSGYRSRFSHDMEEATPGYYSVYLQDYGIKAEMTATTRVAFHRYTFPQADSSRFILDMTQSIYNYDGKVTWSMIRVENDTLITGFRQTRGWAPNRIVFFAMILSKPFQSYGINNDEQIVYWGFGPRKNHLVNYPEVYGKKLKAYFNFSTLQDEKILVKVALSCVSIEGAIKNLGTEIPDWNFDKVIENARKAWSKELNKVIIEASPEIQTIFYTALYHTMLAPVTYMDIDGNYRGLDNNIHIAQGFTNYTIYSLWDTYRATHPLFTILQPDRDGDMISSMIAHYEQNSHKILPVWSFHANETWCMIGYHGVSVIADAWLKGIRNFDAEKGLAAMVASATHESYDSLGYYMKYHYMPIDKENEAASKTLEYAYDDWCIARMAEAMKNDVWADQFYDRASWYRNIYDPGSGFMRAKNSDGTWHEPFDPFYARYGGDYTEGNAWQYSWYVPQDVKGLIGLMGGRERFAERLDSLFILETSEEKYKHVEDIAGLIGQYAHGNEPSQHIAYLYPYAGYPWKTQERIHQIMQNLFDDTPYGICGNEDCGQMSAWYIFSSLGFYPVCPGSNEYIFGTPSITRATLHLENGKTFTIIANDLSEQNIYIQSVSLNGSSYDKCFIRHEDIVRGGEIVFDMGPEPNFQWASSPEAEPYSLPSSR